MKIAIDESGDSGRKFWSGSSRFFILTAVLVPDNMICGPTCQAITDYRIKFQGGAEMHFSHNSHQQHVNFLAIMRTYDFVFVSVCIDKKKLLRTRPQVFRSKMALVQFSFDRLFRELKPWLDDPVVLMDTNGPRHFNRGLTRYLFKKFGARHKGDRKGLKQIRAVDSRSEPLVQLADYVCGAVHHHVDGKHPNSNTYELYLKDKGKIIYI